MNITEEIRELLKTQRIICANEFKKSINANKIKLSHHQQQRLYVDILNADIEVKE